MHQATMIGPVVRAYIFARSSVSNTIPPVKNASVSATKPNRSLKFIVSLLNSLAWVVLWISQPVKAQIWRAVPAASTVSFTIKNAGITVNGSFSAVAATVVFDPDQLNMARITATVPTQTIKTGIKARDKHLRGKDYFETVLYPTMTFTGTSITSQEEGFVAHGTLTIKDVTKPIALPFTFNKQGDQAVFRTNFTLNRLDYHIGSASWLLADDVQVAIVLRAAKEPR